MPAISNLGTILPGGVSLFDLSPAGNGFGRGDSGSAKRFREAGAMSPAFVLAGVFFAGVAPARAPSPFGWACWAAAGKANRALTTTAAHQLRMVRLPKLSVSEPKSPLSPLQRRLWRCHKLAWTYRGKLSAISCHTHELPHNRYISPLLPSPGRKSKKSQNAVA